MKITAVISEFNPFHNGHAYLLDTIKKDCGGAVMCVMSGDVIQRGFLPIIDKYSRAKHAVINNADMVIELPPQYACAPAEIFALGGVATALTAGADTIAFGSECGDIEALKEAAYLTESNDIKLNNEIKNNLGEGMSHASARRKALLDCGYDDIADILDNPNNLLAVEYIRAIKKLAPDTKLYTVQRISSAHDDTNISGSIASSSAIRHSLTSENTLPGQCMPPYVCEDLKINTKTQSNLLSIIKYIVCNKDISNICGMIEGLDIKIKKCIMDSKTLSDAVALVKSKRYTESRIRRLLTNIAIYNTFNYEMLKSCKIDYLNVLAMRSTSKELISSFKAPVTIRPYDKERLHIQDDLSKRASYLFKSCVYNYKDKAFIKD